MSSNADKQKSFDAAPQNIRLMFIQLSNINNWNASQLLNHFDAQQGNYSNIPGEIKTKADQKADLVYSDMKTSGDPFAEFWTKEQFREAFQKRWQAENFEAGVEVTAGQVVRSQISNEFQTAVKDGTVDPETGKRLKEGEVTKHETTVRDTLEKLGIEMSDAAVDHFAKLIQSGELDAFEIENLLKASPEFQQQELERQYGIAKGEITEAEQRELAILSDEAIRTQKMTEQDFARIAPELAQFAKQLGGRTREDTFIGDTLTKERTELERRREDNLAIQRTQIKFGQEQRRQALEEGQFGETRAITSNIQSTALQAAERALQDRQKTMTRLSQIQSQRSSILSQRAFDRFQRDLQKRMDRANRTAQDAQNRANRKARKFGGFAQIGSGAVTGFMAGGPVGAIVGAGIGFAQQQVSNQGVQAPNVNISQAAGAFGKAPSFFGGRSTTDRSSFTFDPYTGRRL